MAGDADWNDKTIARLIDLWAEGHSTAEIGRRMNLSKNAVVGKARRLNLPARPSPIRRDGGPAPPRPPARVRGPTLPVLASVNPAPVTGGGILPQPAPLRLVAPPPRVTPGRSSACLYPMWGDADRPGPAFRFCEASTAGSASNYCPEHHARCYDPVPRRQLTETHIQAIHFGHLRRRGLA